MLLSVHVRLSWCTLHFVWINFQVCELLLIYSSCLIVHGVPDINMGNIATLITCINYNKKNVRYSYPRGQLIENKNKKVFLVAPSC